jgi:hypothetical protein
MTHDDKRHGTTSLFAALDVATGTGIGQCMKRHRHQEFLRFLRTIDRQTPKKRDLHLVLDNYATHKHSNVKTWLAKYPRFHLHFTPTLASWLNQVERFFGLITQERIRRGVFTSAPQLEAASTSTSTITMPTPSSLSGPNWPKKSSQKSPGRETHSNSVLPGIKR